MKAFENKTDAELTELLKEKREALRGIRFNASGSGMRDTNARKNIRREIARILTEMNRRAKEAKTTNA